MPIPSNVIINADDFGATSTKNIAIARCFSEGLINSTSIMANMNGFDEAVEISRKESFTDKIGLHVNLTEGKPITDLTGTCLIDAKGAFIKENADKKFIFLSDREKKMAKAEVEAQLTLLYDNHIHPAHINSHHHVHTLPWLVPIFLNIAKKHNIKIRIAQTWNTNKNILIPGYRSLLNGIYKRNKLNFTDRFETFESFTRLSAKKNGMNGLVEIMVHPDLGVSGELIDSYEGNVFTTLFK